MIPYLKPGDTIGIAATARHVSPQEMAPAVSVFESWGLRVVFAKGLYEKSGPFAGSDEQRAESLQLLLDDDSVNAVVCARGGYGTVRIIDKLNFSGFCKKPKWICGFSDVTVLLSHLYRNYNIPGLHSCMPITMQGALRDEESMKTLRKALFGEVLSYSFTPDALSKPETIEGILVGGNLSVLYSMMGTPSEMNFDDCILFIEDIGEYYYHIDRMMLALKRAGKLKNLKGLLVGGMNDMNENNPPFAFGKTCYEIIAETVSDYNYPVFFGFPAGHEKVNQTFWHGAFCSLQKAQSGVLFKQQV